MAAGDITQGTRIYDKKPWDLKPSEYLVAGDGSVWVVAPNGLGPSNLKTWNTEIHEDGTVTLSPSIMAYGHSMLDEDGNKIDLPDWHGYLENGVWREV